MKFIKENYIGVLFSFIIAVVSWLLGKEFPIVGGPIFAILLGIVLAPFLNKESSKVGIQFTAKKVLQYAIIFLGFEMNLNNIIKVGQQSLLIMLFTLTGAFLSAYFFGKFLKLDGKVTTLIGVGTCICGGSAIAATSPVIRASNKDISMSISTIFLFNILAVFLFPAIGHLLGMSDIGFGMWAGTAINDTSSVVAASSAWSIEAGNNVALTFATIVKLTRTLLIIPITLVLSVWTSKRENQENNFSFIKVFPWFVIGFIVAALINTYIGLPVEISQGLTTLGKFLIVCAMAAIGLNTKVKDLLSNGIRPILLGFGCWVVVSTISICVQMLIHVW